MEHALGLFVRATATYMFLLVLIRISGKRTVHEGTPFDFVVALVLGDFPDDIIWGEVPVAQGLVAIGTVVATHLCVVYASYRSVWFDRLVASGRTLVVRSGRALREGLRRERMNSTDLDIQLRHRGVDNPSDVEEASIEPCGEIAVILTESARPARRADLAPHRTT